MYAKEITKLDSRLLNRYYIVYVAGLPPPYASCLCLLCGNGVPRIDVAFAFGSRTSLGVHGKCVGLSILRGPRRYS